MAQRGGAAEAHNLLDRLDLAQRTMHVAPWMRHHARCTMHAWQDEDEKAHLREQLEILSMTLEGKQRREEAVSTQPTNLAKATETVTPNRRAVRPVKGHE